MTNHVVSFTREYYLSYCIMSFFHTKKLCHVSFGNSWKMLLTKKEHLHRGHPSSWPVCNHSCGYFQCTDSVLKPLFTISSCTCFMYPLLRIWIASWGSAHETRHFADATFLSLAKQQQWENCISSVCSLDLQLTQHTPAKPILSVCCMNENAYSDITINETESILSYICTHRLTSFTLCGKGPQ